MWLTMFSSPLIYVASARKLGSPTQEYWGISRRATDDFGRAAVKQRAARARLSSSVVALTCICFFAVGCAPSLKGNEPREPNREVPASFGGASAQETSSSAQRKWREFFDSSELKALIETALERSQELNIRLQEIIIAQNEVSARQGEYLPKVNAGAGAGVEKVGKHTSQGASDEAHGVPENLGNFTFGLTGSWEVDIWKKLRNAAKAADLRYLASIEGRNFMVTQIVAEIARSYFELIAIDNQLDVLRRNIEVQTDALEVVKLQKQAARVTELAVQRFEAEVLKNRSRLYDLEQEKIQTENRINFLVGRYPQPVRRNSEEFKARLPDVAKAGLPSQLLDNRPDVRQAELELAAAKLDVKVAKAAFYPSLSIDAGVGYRSFNAEHLVATPESLFYGLAGSLTAPLLNRKAIAAQYRSANAKQLQAVFNYERTLLQAFTDVANQLAMIENLRKSYELQSQQVEALARSSEVSSILFQSARADYMEVLMTRRDSLEGEMSLIETKKRQLQAMVNIYQALGGGWRSGT
jgi:NodT family efflux transporter outer membrane factor (OMF) lipoprotein